MSTYDVIDFDDDCLDVRDLIERFETLESEEELTSLEIEEFETLKEILEELKGNGGDEQWNGDWYPVTLISENYFESYMDDLLEECDMLPRDLPSYINISIDYDQLKWDYTSIDIRGNTYWYR